MARGRKPANRSVAEQEEFDRLRRQRNAEAQRRRRAQQRAVVDEARGLLNNNNHFPNNTDNMTPITVQDSQATIPNSETRNDFETFIPVNENITININENNIDNEHLRRCQRSEAQRRRRTEQRNRIVEARRHMNEYEEHYIGEMNILCVNCRAKHFEKEKVGKGCSFNDCCSHGAVKIEKNIEFSGILEKFIKC